MAQLLIPFVSIEIELKRSYSLLLLLLLNFNSYLSSSIRSPLLASICVLYYSLCSSIPVNWLLPGQGLSLQSLATLHIIHEHIICEVFLCCTLLDECLSITILGFASPLSAF